MVLWRRYPEDNMPLKFRVLVVFFCLFYLPYFFFIIFIFLVNAAVAIINFTALASCMHLKSRDTKGNNLKKKKKVPKDTFLPRRVVLLCF